MSRITGEYKISTTSGESVKAFIPKPLPPVPPLHFDDETQALLKSAEIALQQLRVAVDMVPNRELFNYAFVRKEAVLSSQIENVQATLTDLFNYESEAVDLANSHEIQEVCNYLDALRFCQKQLKSSSGLPISLRLLKEAHKRLMKGVRGANKKPGEFRDSQNWVGGTRPGNAHYVPPPPQEMLLALSDLEKYTHHTESMPLLVKIGFIHVQFESIHPFLDGNGRLGRLIIVLLLEEWGLADALSLYPSLHFKRNRNLYYENLTRVRQNGDWEAWTKFFLEAIAISAKEATELSRNIFLFHSALRALLLADPAINVATLRLFEKLPMVPVLTLNRACQTLGVTKPTANKALEQLTNAKILKKITAGKRNRIFSYDKYLKLLIGDAG